MDPLHLETSRTLLRHLVATLTYRAAKVLRDAPPEFGGMTFGSSTRTPVLIVAHLADLMSWAVRLAQGEYLLEGGRERRLGHRGNEVRRRPGRSRSRDRRRRVARGAVENPVEKLIQGPLADALTHVGQLAMLRGMAGSPIRPESYARAEIVIGRVGMEQTPPRAPFDGDASVRT